MDDASARAEATRGPVRRNVRIVLGENKARRDLIA